ncbi:polysaccharide pyruvyl transferase family protein [Brachybacterium sp. AOP43-C2-M15]|uniref:polysaccharide pyruvyl transferase family protein n=1 Tax=Brachybacterium sp. AOP43-C2-M15 TaxID=3457661 RepID=UPI004033724A
MSGTPTDAPRVLVLWAAESSPNLGVAALARGSRDLLRRLHPDVELVFANYGARPPQVPWGRPRSLLRERVVPRFGMQEFFAGFDLVWDTRSGDSFADIYGVGRHLTMSLVHEFATQAGASVVMAPQTIGPFGTRRGRALAHRSLHRSTTVLARDPDSARAADELGRPADLMTADLAFAIEPPAPERSFDVLLNVSGLLWNENPHVDAQSYQRIIRETIAVLRAEGREVTLLAHVLDSPDPDNDVPVVKELAAELGGELEVVVPTGLDDVRTTIAGADVLIGSRMHACLNALSVGVPAVPLAYSRKFAPLLQSVGWETGFDLRSDDPQTLPEGIAAAVASADPATAHAAAARGRASLDAAVELLRHVNAAREPRLTSLQGTDGR